MGKPSRILAMLLFASAACGCSKSSVTPDDVDSGATPPPPPPPYTLTAIDKARIGSKEGASDFQKAKGEIDLQSGPFAEVTLVADLETTCFPFDKWKTEPPPPGQNYPASCDAFDRNFDVALVDPAAPDAPGFELVHAITPFGGPLHVEVDVTDLFQTLRGKRSVEITIPTYSDGEGKITGSNGGWTVSARFEVTPGDAPRKVLGVVPILYDSLTTGATEQRYPFTLPEGTTYTRLEYIASGHGGGDVGPDCIGPAEEFCRRRHTLTGDGAAIVTGKELWRTDCAKLCTSVSGGPFGSYCKQNPCGAPESVRAPRANWCPGSVTPALEFEPESFAKPGPHTLGVTIDTIAEKGSWRVSAKVFAYGERP